MNLLALALSACAFASAKYHRISQSICCQQIVINVFMVRNDISYQDTIVLEAITCQHQHLVPILQGMIATSRSTSKNIFGFDSRATGSSGSILGFLGPSSSSSDEDSSSAEGIGDSAILYWNRGIGLLQENDSMKQSDDAS